MTNKATTNDLRALVAELKPRSPEEVMGSAASSNLMRSMSTATLASLGLLVAATTVMFAAGFGPSDSAGTPQVTESESGQADSAAETAGETATEDETTTDSTAVASETTDEGSSTESAIDAMGIGDAAAPDSDPETLENRLDKILDGLE